MLRRNRIRGKKSFAEQWQMYSLAGGYDFYRRENFGVDKKDTGYVIVQKTVVHLNRENLP